MHPIEQRLPFFCQPFFCQIELRGWDVAASRNTKFTLAGNSIVRAENVARFIDVTVDCNRFSNARSQEANCELSAIVPQLGCR